MQGVLKGRLTEYIPAKMGQGTEDLSNLYIAVLSKYTQNQRLGWQNTSAEPLRKFLALSGKMWLPNKNLQFTIYHLYVNKQEIQKLQ